MDVQDSSNVAERQSPSGIAGPLPTDLVATATKRLGIVCLVAAAIWLLQLMLNNVVGPLLSPGSPLDDAWPWPGNPIALVAIVVSMALYAYTRSASSATERVLDVGLGYEVALALAIGLVNQWTPNTTGLSWICILVLVFPSLVPATGRKTLVAALAAASMDPVGVAVTAARGVEIPSFPTLLWAFLPNYVCAILAVLPSHIIRGLSHQVRSARELGSYQLGELLGRGGMGEVYAARHRLLRRPAAIKLVHPDTRATPDSEPPAVLVQRFKREAEAAASLHSPHTIALYDFGVSDDGSFYYVMELLRGLDLDTLVDRFGPMPPNRISHLLQQACHSLAEAHAVGLVHRDVKPANLFTCWVGLEPDFVKVLDFGLVKGQLGEVGEQAKLTAPDMATGTPGYMSPELARGEDIDSRADIYALGCVAYWLLTGRLVFDASTPMKMMLAHIRNTPLPPSHHSELSISRELDELILSCLEKDRERRPSSALELARRLVACDVGPPWTAEMAEQWWRTNLPELVPERSSKRPTVSS